MTLVLLLAASVGYLAAAPVLVWHRRDLLSFRTLLWAGYGSRAACLRGAGVCYLAAGWPELLMALGWRNGMTRAALIAERENFRSARQPANSSPDT
jgi:hypothetical protein